MRILLLPVSTRQSVLYCPRIKFAALSASSAATTTSGSAAPAPSYIDRITAKANTTWSEWEKKDSGWQKRVATYGNQLLKRLPYQEYGLKSLPPLNRAAKEKWDEALRELSGPQIDSKGAPERRKSAKATHKENLSDQRPVSVEFPAATMEENQVWNELKRLGSNETQGFHTRRLLWCLVGMPISAPFALIPIQIDWRASKKFGGEEKCALRVYSLSRATISDSKAFVANLEYQICRSSTFAIELGHIGEMAYMEAALNHKMKKIDVEVEALRSPSNVATKDADGEVELEPFGGDERMLLSSSSGQTIASWSNVPEIQADIDRAVWQVQKSVQAKRELAEEKRELDSVHRKAEQQR